MYNRFTDMINLLKNLYNKIESLRGKSLIIFGLVVIVIFLIVGITIGYFTNDELNQNETAEQRPTVNLDPNAMQEYDGKIQYIDPSRYPQDKITYKLVDPNGKEIILLKAKDDKLKLAEGLTVKVKGTKGKTVDSKNDYLLVKEIQINTSTNATN